MAKKKSKTQKLKKSIKKTTKKKLTGTKEFKSAKKVVATKKIVKPKTDEDKIELPKRKVQQKKTKKGALVPKSKVQYKLYEKNKKKSPPRKTEIKKVQPKKIEPKKVEPKKIEPTMVEPKKIEPKKVIPSSSTIKVEEPKKETIKVDITKMDNVDLEKTIDIIIPKEEKKKPKKNGTIAPQNKVKSKILDKLFAKKEKPKNKNKIITTSSKNINDLKALFNTSTEKTKKENRIIVFFQNLKKKFKKNKDKNKKVEEPAIVEEVEETEIKKERRVPKNPILRIIYEIIINLYIFFDILLIGTFIFLIVGLKRVEVIPNNIITYIVCIFAFLGLVAFSYNKYLSGKIFTLCLVGIMGFGIYLLQYNFDFINNLNTKEYEYKEYNVVAFDNAYNKSIYNINNKTVCLLNSNAKNEKRVLNLKLDDVTYVGYDTQDEMFEDFYGGKCRAVIITSNQIKFLTNNKETEHQNVKVLYTFKANGHK